MCYADSYQFSTNSAKQLTRRVSLALLSQNKLLSPCDSHLLSPSPISLKHRTQEEPWGQRSRGHPNHPHPSPCVILSLRGKSCQQHHTQTLRNEEEKRGVKKKQKKNLLGIFPLRHHGKNLQIQSGLGEQQLSEAL